MARVCLSTSSVSDDQKTDQIKSFTLKNYNCIK